MDAREREKDEPPTEKRREIDGEARKSREELDSIPEPGTDPLNEGP